VKPVLQALLLADQVYTDATTGKKVVAGIFHTVRLHETPPPPPTAESPGVPGPVPVPRQHFRSGSPFAYVSLTNVRGKMGIDLRFVDLADNLMLMSTHVELQPKVENDPLSTLELVMELPILPFPHPGYYALELYAENELIGSHRVQAVRS